MLNFRIRRQHGKGRHLVYWCVYVQNGTKKEWIFLKALGKESRALKYIEYLKKKTYEGDYSWLVMK